MGGKTGVVSRCFSLLSVVLVAVACAAPGVEPTPQGPCPELEAEDCSAAIVFTIDKSGSMEEETENGETVLEVVKEAAAAVVRDAPSGQWHMGLTTFPAMEGTPTWGLYQITDQPDTRESLIATIESLTPGGWTDILAGAYEGLYLLSQAPDYLPRILVIISDGRVCQVPDCSLVRQMADYIRQQGVFIISVGYRLDGPEYDIMEYIASTRPDGSRAFSNAGTGAELFSLISEHVGSVCRYQPVGLEWDPPEARMAAGGSSSHLLTARYRYGPETTYRFGSWQAYGISIENVGPDFTLGPGQCAFTQKVTIAASDSTQPGIYYPYGMVREVSTNVGVGALYIPVTVSGFSADVSFVELPEPPAWQAGSYTGQVRVVPYTAQPVPVTFSALVYRSGETETAPGWMSQVLPQATATVEAGTPVTVTFHLIPPADATPGDIFQLDFIVTGEGARFAAQRLFTIEE
jgi:hypothetical protein